MGHLAATGRFDLGTIREALAWGTVAASHTIAEFGLTGLQNATDESMRERFDRFRTITSF